MTKLINLNEQKNEYKYVDEAIKNTNKSVFKNFIDKIESHPEEYLVKDDLDVFKAYGVYLELLDCNNLNEPDYKEICVLDFFFRSCQYLEFLNIYYHSDGKSLQLLYYLFMIHRTKFNKDLDPKNILIFIIQQKIKAPEGTVVEEPKNLFELLNNNYRYWNYYIKILDITEKIDYKIDEDYSDDNSDESRLISNINKNDELTTYFKKIGEFIKYETCDFYVPLNIYNKKRIDDSFLPYSCYQLCKTFEITTKAEIQSQEHMDNYFKTEYRGDSNILTNEPVNNNDKNLIGEDVTEEVIEEVIKANPEYVRKFDTTSADKQNNEIPLNDKYCKLLVEYNLSYLCLKLTNIILQNPSQVEKFKHDLSDKEKLYFQRVCQHI